MISTMAVVRTDDRCSTWVATARDRRCIIREEKLVQLPLTSRIIVVLVGVAIATSMDENDRDDHSGEHADHEHRDADLAHGAQPRRRLAGRGGILAIT